MLFRSLTPAFGRRGSGLKDIMTDLTESKTFKCPECGNTKKVDADETETKCPSCGWEDPNLQDIPEDVVTITRLEKVKKLVGYPPQFGKAKEDSCSNQ